MAFSTIIGAVGLGFQMVGAARQAKAQKMQLEAQADQQRAQAKIAKKQEHQQLVNSEIAKLNALEVSKLAIDASQRRGLETAQTVGAARAIVASKGLVLNQPGTTPEKLQQDLIEAGAMDVYTIFQNSQAEQVRALQQAENFTMQADIFDEHATSMYDVARHTDQQAGMISPGFAAIATGFSGLSNLLV